MASLLDRKLLVITGKGGAGKTTISAAIGVLAASRGLRTIVVEVGEQGRLPGLFGRAARDPGVETQLEERLSSISIDPDRALLEWLQSVGGRVSGRMLASSSTFQYFAAAAPGAKELVSMVKVWELTQGERWRRRAAGYDLVVLDAPATGHALGMLRSPWTFGAIARVGPIAGQSERVRELLQDPALSSYLVVAQGTEMAVTETLELRDGLHRQLQRDLHAVIVNGLLPQRFTGAELHRITQLNGGEVVADGAGLGRQGAGAGRPGERSEAVTRRTAPKREASADVIAVTRSAARAAQAVHDRARFQHNQVARLRRRDVEVLTVPFVFVTELDLPAVRRIAEHLGRRL
jgi:anion-transporting  ArsA/GET3 family ATPase